MDKQKEEILEKVDRINMRLNWLGGISELMGMIDYKIGFSPRLENVNSLIDHLIEDIKKDVSSIWKSLGGNVEKGGEIG
jgi:hypothetical protein